MTLALDWIELVNRRTYSKKNLSSGYSEKKDRENNKDNVRPRTIKRMQVLAYFLLGTAALALGFAGFHGFPNKSVTIISAGIGGVLTIVSFCCLWQAVVWADEAKP
jgi:hypothetical protein